MTIYLYLAAIAVLIAFSAFFSAAEVSFSAANRIRLENMRETGSKSAAAACAVLDRYDNALSAILIGNNLVNIAASSIGSVAAILLASEEYVFVSTAVITVLIITFGETMPKIAAKKSASRLSLIFAYPISFLMLVLWPVIFIIVGLAHLLSRPFPGEKDASQDAAVEELQSIIETAENEDVLDEDRSELLQAVLDFPDISINEIMTSRVDMIAVNIEESRPALLAALMDADYSRIPVYEGSVDSVIGVLHLNRLFKALVDDEDADIRSLLMEPVYVYKTLKLPAVLNELRRKQTHIAIVTDEYGGTLGVVTMEDILEQIVGEIWDETDDIEHGVVEKDDNSYEVDGDLSIGDFCEQFDLDEEELDSESTTVGGWTLEMFGGYPIPGESFMQGRITVTVLEMDGLRVDKILVKVEEPEGEE